MPEELNRFVTDHLSNFLFTPNFKAKKILTKEGVKGKIYVVGDVMYDVFLASKRFVEQRKDKVLSKYSLQKKNYFFLTVHRKENTLNFKAYQNVFKFIKKLKLEKKIIFPAHPRLKNFHKKLKYPSNIKVIKPIDYIETQILLANALCCLTDSGGLQKEAYFNRVKCLTLRDETEWTETINNGWNVLWNKNRLIYKKQKNIDYGDGNASQKIYKILLKNL
jgi:UDP-N-acetylglucosamine 2-epimerase